MFVPRQSACALEKCTPETNPELLKTNNLSCGKQGRVCAGKHARVTADTFGGGSPNVEEVGGAAKNPRALLSTGIKLKRI
jgi:hypothetical protein